MRRIRRFPRPWTVGCSEYAFWVEDADGNKFAYTFFAERTNPDAPNYRNALSREEARRISANVAKLPELLLKRRSK